MIRDFNYYVIQGWMVNILQLKGCDLNVYAILYSITQGDIIRHPDIEGYICELSNQSIDNVLNSLERLKRKNIIRINMDKSIEFLQFPLPKTIKGKSLEKIQRA